MRRSPPVPHDHDGDGIESLRHRQHNRELRCEGKPAIPWDLFWFPDHLDCVHDWHDDTTYDPDEWDTTALHAAWPDAIRSCADPDRPQDSRPDVLGVTHVLRPSGTWHKVHRNQDPEPITAP